MAAPQLSLPKQWEDWCKWLLGFWLWTSPWLLQFDLELRATLTAVITGIVIVFVERMTLYFYRVWEEWINVILGVWLIICPWILSISVSAARDNFVVVGLLVMALSFYEIWEARHQSRNRG
jgi:SPW repeat